MSTINKVDKLAEIYQALEGVVLRDIEKRIKATHCDTSAIAPEHVLGYEAGWRAMKNAALDALAD